MKEIIFVCSGNTCRSPMAEEIAKSFCKNSEISIKSKGLFVLQKTGASPNSATVIKKYNLSLSNHISSQLTYFDVENATLILTMTKEHKKIILNNFSNLNPNVFTIYEYTTNLDKNIQDPFGLELEDYYNCVDEIYELIKKINFNKI